MRVRVLFATVLLAIGSAATASPAAAGPAPTTRPAGLVCDGSARADATSAQALARHCGQQVEVIGERSGHNRTYANADGSMTAEISTVPMRTRRPDGSWVSIDTTLRRQPDGTVAPIATTMPMRFSGGGSGPLVTADGWSVTWPAALPKPRIQGDAAVYPDVFPGADLRVRALREGFSYVLVVRTREALNRAELRRIAVGMPDLTLRPRPDGGFDAARANGSLAFSTTTAAMWDASAGATADGPEDGTRTAPVPLSTSGHDLVLTPGADWLADPALTLPVYLDPQQVGAGRSTFAYANSAEYTYSPNVGDVARVGRNPECCGGEWHPFFQYNLAPFIGKHIVTAEFKSVVTHSWNCTATPATLWTTSNLATGLNGTRVGWSSMVWYMAQGTAYADSCRYPDNSPSWTVTPQVQWWADNGWGQGTFALDGHDSDTHQWKKFSAANTSLVIIYNSVPVLYTVSMTGTSQSAGCYTTRDAGQPTINTNNGATFATSVGDSEAGDVLVARFEWQDLTAGTAVTLLPDTAGFNAPHTFTVNVPGISLLNNHEIQFRVRVFDGADYSGYGGWCHFRVENTPPSRPSIASAGLPAFPAAPPASTKVGSPVPVTFSPASGDVDIVGYYYTVSNVDPVPTTYVAAGAGGSATLTVVPVVADGAFNYLSVVAVDASGNQSTRATFTGAFQQPGLLIFLANGAS